MNPLIEHVPSMRWPMPPLTNYERRELWRRKYVRVPIEATCEPITQPDPPSFEDEEYTRTTSYDDLSQGA